MNAELQQIKRFRVNCEAAAVGNDLADLRIADLVIAVQETNAKRVLQHPAAIRLRFSLISELGCVCDEDGVQERAKGTVCGQA